MNLKIFVALVVLLSSVFFDCNSSKEEKKTPGEKSGSDQNTYFPVSNSSATYINEGKREETELYKVNQKVILNNPDSIIVEFDGFPFFSKEKNSATINVMRSGEVYVIQSSGSRDLLLPAANDLKSEYKWKYGYWDCIVTDTNVNVKTENGSFEGCRYINYILGGFTFSTELWLAKDKGIVKWGYHRTNPPTRVIAYYVLK